MVHIKTVVIPYYLSLRYNETKDDFGRPVVVIPYYLSLRYNWRNTCL